MGVGRVLSLLSVLVLVLASATPALAHGGNYEPRFKAPTREPEHKRETTTDPAAALTRWEVWWGSQRDVHLRFPERNRAAARATTPSAASPSGSSAPPLDEDAARLARMQRALPVLERALTDADPEVRGSAAIALGKTGLTRASELLLARVVKETEEEPFQAILLALGLSGRDDGVAVLDDVLGRPGMHTFDRGYAAMGLGLVGGETASVALRHFLDQGVQEVADTGRRRFRLQATAITALGLLGDPAARAWLRTTAEELPRRSNLRPFVLLALGRMEDASARPILLAALDARSPRPSRRAAAFSLGRVLAADDAKGRLALLTALQGDEDAIVRRYAAVSLGRLDHQDARDQLFEVFRLGRDDDRAHVALALGLQHDRRSIPELRRALEAEQDGSRRSAYVTALGLLGDRESIPVVREELAAADGWRQAYAALALGMLGDDGARPLLWRRLRAARDDAPLRANLSLALGMLDDPQLPGDLVARLADPDSRSDAAGAAITLGTVRPVEVLDDLLKLATTELGREPAERRGALAYVVVSIGRLVDPRAVPRLTELSVDHDPALVVRPLSDILGIL